MTTGRPDTPTTTAAATDAPPSPSGPTGCGRVSIRSSPVAGGASPASSTPSGPRATLDGAHVVSFASNDYLGLSSHPAVVDAAVAATRRWGAGAGASRLVTGSRPVHTALEVALAEWKETDAAICFPTGFAANLGALSVLGGPEVRVLSDELNHASIIDGCRLSRSQLSIYRHCDMAHLSALLEGSPAHADDRGHRHDLLHGRRRRPCGARSPRCAAGTARSSSSTKRMQSSGRTCRRTSRATRTSPWSGWGRCPRRWVRWAGSWPARRM